MLRFSKKKQGPGRLRRCQDKRHQTAQAIQRGLGQATIEMVLGLIACFMLFLCTVQLFVWITRCLVERNESYEKTRIIAGGYDQSGQMNPGAPFQDSDPNTELWTPPEFIPK